MLPRMKQFPLLIEKNVLRDKTGVEVKNLGLIFDPENHLPTGYTYASNPVAVNLNSSNNQIRIFFSSRNEKGKSYVFYADFTYIKNRFKHIYTSAKPSLSPGIPGLFDEDGISIGSIIFHQREMWLYYLGWQLQNSVPWMNTIGLAKSSSMGKDFVRFGKVPIMDRSEEDPFSMSYPWVMRTDSRFEMWYGSNRKWGKTKRDMEHVIKHAWSVDGIQWTRDPKAVFPLNETMQAMSRPTVISSDQRVHMLLSVKDRDGKYSLRYAIRENDKPWIMKNNSFYPSGAWDSQSQSYPSFFKMGNEVFVLYNGNGYGKTGFGIFKFGI